MKVILRSTAAIKPYDKNPRINDAAIAAVARSIQEFGLRQPVVIDEHDTIIVGHTRLMAAVQLGMEEIPVHIAEGLTDAQKKAYRIADNQTATIADWDDELLTAEIMELNAADFDLEALGFDDDELRDIMGTSEENEGLTDPDAVPAPPEEVITKPGDLWIMGKHRLLCGDATKAASWNTLDIYSEAICFTSPPYNLGPSSKLSGNKSATERGSSYVGHEDNMDGNAYFDLLSLSLSHALVHCPAAMFNVQCLARSKREIIKWINTYVDYLCDIAIWNKGHGAPPMADGVLTAQHEWLVLFSNVKEASRKIPCSSWRGTIANVYDAPPQRQNEHAGVHAATFPVHLPTWVIGELMDQCKAVVDPFMGTGTTLIAAEQLGRCCYGIEIEPRYCDIIVRRWEEFTGERAIGQKAGPVTVIIPDGDTSEGSESS